tara:strand:+ start:62 stop:658 length:597 start_codon:yes stop_codon:yes gene_type:complete
MKHYHTAFVISNTDYEKCPTPNIPEYAFIGRSNVGKSSLINLLANHKNLAKISGKPGKTKLINHYIVNNQWYLVDLPGFGYAQISKSTRAGFEKMIQNYLLKRTNLMCLFFLIDCRHKPQKKDQDFMKWLAINKIAFVIIFTKVDKINKNILKKNINFYKSEMLKDWQEVPEIFITSAKQKIGTKDIINFIQNTNKLF